MHHERLNKPRVVRKLLGYNSYDEGEKRQRSRPWQSTDTDSDTSDSNNKSSPIPIPSRVPPTHRGYCSDSSPCKNLPPIGVFWDIENCQIPKGRSAVAVAQVIRDKFFDGYREAEFLVVCDIKKESSQVMDELNDAQVTLNHVGSQCKNAADEKLRQCIRRFADLHGSMAAIVLISGDINFAPDLCDLRHRKKIYVILVHNDLCSENLMLCANEHYRFSELVENLPLRGTVKSAQPAEVTVSALPAATEPSRVRQRLKRLAENCGGRVGIVAGELATVRFPTVECAMRAQKRMDGEDVFGSLITVSQPIIVNGSKNPKDFSPVKANYRRPNGRRDDDPGYIWTNSSSLSSSNPTSSYSNGNSQPPPLSVFNQENIPVFFAKKSLNFSSQPRQNQHTFAHHKNSKSNVGRPILGRRNEPNHFGHQNGHHNYLKNYQSGRLSLDSMLDCNDITSDIKPLRPPSLEPWPQNESEMPRINTSLPPPPIVNLPRKDSQFLFQPIPMKPVAGTLASSTLLVTNLDQTIDPLEMKRLLYTAVSQYCLVLNVSLLIQVEGQLVAHIKVQPQNVDVLLHNLQGSKIGNSAVTVSLLSAANSEGNNAAHSPSPASSTSDSGELWFCSEHSQQSRMMKNLPCVTVRLSEFSKNLHALLTAHENRLPLTSLVDCYEAHCGPLITDTQSVSLEHLVTCVPGIELVNASGKKYLQPSHNTISSNWKISADLEASLKEKLVDLLQAQPNCVIPLNRFIPTYKQHFGTQLTFSDYGCRRLIDVLNAAPNIVQIVGASASRLVTLVHTVQVDRFTADLLKVLNSRPNKQVALPDLSMYWQQIIGKRLEAMDYGLCHVDDLLSLVSSEKVSLKGQAAGKVISIVQPIVKSSAVQHDKLTLFSQQVVELLGLEEDHSMPLNKFVAAYHQHFKTQCKVSDYGFSKLNDLFRAIPHAVTVIKSADGSQVVVPVDQKLRRRVLRILWETTSGRMSVHEFQTTYLRYYNQPCDISVIKTTMAHVVEISQDSIYQLTKLELLARDMYRLLCVSKGRLSLAQLEAKFHRVLNTALLPAQYGYQSLFDLLQALDHVVVISGKGAKRVLALNSQLAEAGIYLPSENLPKDSDKDDKSLNKSDNPAQALLNGLKSKKNGEKIVSPVPLDLIWKNMNLPLNGVKPKITNGLKPSTAVNVKLEQVANEMPKLTLLSPEQFLKPKPNCALSFAPVSPDPSSLPKPLAFNLTQASQGQSEYEQTCSESIEENKRKFRLAAHFGVQPS